MKIFIDADACPVVDIVIEVAEKYDVGVVLIYDTSHIFDIEGVEKIIVSKGADSADFVIINRVKKNDIVVTQDMGLASMCLARNARIINQNGFSYTNENIDYMLMNRYISKKLRAKGYKTGTIKKRTKENDIAFKTALDKMLIEEYNFNELTLHHGEAGGGKLREND